MENGASRLSTYALGHDAHELTRLGRQSEIFEPFTRQLFRESGIGPGMQILDVGSGAGDVAFLAADLIGPMGHVTGVDCAEAAVQWATARCLARRIENVDFLLGDPAEMVFKAPFDAVVGRFVLMYYPDPICAIRSLAQHLRPGGIMVFQEFDMSYVRSYPAAPTFEHASQLMTNTLHTLGTRVHLGADLYSIFVAAGLPGPSMRMDVLIGGGEKFPGYEILAETIQSLLPAMERFGIATAALVNLPSLAERMREEVIARNGIAFSPALIGAWSRES